MTSSQCQEIGEERVASWVVKFVEEHATPFVMVGIGHDHKSGNIVLVTVDDDIASRRTVKAILQKAIQLL